MKPTQRSIAHPNIALAKYWGKRPFGHNLPAVPSLSVTLGGMSTITEVTLDPELDEDVLELDGRPVVGRPVHRVSQLFDLLVAEGRGGPRPRARVKSRNDFPTAAGLASSASAFAALAVAGDAAFETGLSAGTLSCVARRVSASAGRSLFGGFVVLPAGEEGMTTLQAQPLAPAEHWDLRLTVAVTAEGAKDVGSTEGMVRTAATSPLYEGWLRGATPIFEVVREAVLARDLEALGPAIEQSALVMHASAIAANPGLLYWNGVTVEVMRAVRRLRAEGLGAYFTIDAGPHVKVVSRAADAEAVGRALAAVPGVLHTITARPGPGAHLAATDAGSDGASTDGGPR